jgi:hypothetical protein
MANKGISLSEIERKEAELEQVIQEYYRYDMAALKAEINNILSVETEKLERDRRAKAAEIDEKFNQIVSLGSNHLKQGSKHKMGWQESGATSEEQLL